MRRRHANGRSGEIIPGAGAGRSATGAGDWRSPDGKGGTLAETDQQIAEEQRKTEVTAPQRDAPMGNESDPIAVVDACGKAFGIAGLFVVDARCSRTFPLRRPIRMRSWRQNIRQPFFWRIERGIVNRKTRKGAPEGTSSWR